MFAQSHACGLLFDRVSDRTPSPDGQATIAVAHVPVQSTPFGEPVRPQILHLIVDALVRAGHAATTVEIDSAQTIARLAENPNQIVFNLCYGLKATESQPALSQAGIAAEFESQGLRLIGTGSEAQEACQDKADAATLAATIGIESPRHFSLKEALDQPGPLLIKPKSGAAHRGIRIIDDTSELIESPPLDTDLIQEYLDGPEYTIGVLEHPKTGPYVLPLVRIRYKRSASNPAIYEWGSATMAPDSPNRFGMSKMALDLFKLFNLRGYARFDLRAVQGRGPVLMDVNALPNLAPRQLLATSARWAGLQYPDLIQTIARSEVDRTATCT